MERTLSSLGLMCGGEIGKNKQPVMIGSNNHYNGGMEGLQKK